MTTNPEIADDRGYTLVEMLVTVIMFTLIVGSITTVVITGLKHQKSLQDRGSALASVRTAIEQVDRDIRSANPLCYGTGTELTMLETDPAGGILTANIIVDYKLNPDGTALQYTRYQSNGSAGSNSLPGISCAWRQVNGTTSSTSTLYAGTQITTRTVIGNLVGTSSSPPFLLSGTTYDICPANGTTGAGSTLNYPAVPTTVPAITVNLAAQPATLTHPVSASDCGTYLPNSFNPL